MNFLNSEIVVRLRAIEKEEIEARVKNDPDRFENISQFVRVACLRLLQDHKINNGGN